MNSIVLERAISQIILLGFPKQIFWGKNGEGGGLTVMLDLSSSLLLWKCGGVKCDKSSVKCVQALGQVDAGADAAVRGTLHGLPAHVLRRRQPGSRDHLVVH